MVAARSSTPRAVSSRAVRRPSSKAAPRTRLSGFTPNVEAIAAYRPDLVVIAYDPKGLSTALRRLGITVVHHDGARSFSGAFTQIRQLGLLTGHAAEELPSEEAA